MRNSSRHIRIFLTLAMVWSVGSQATALGQQIELTLPKDDPSENSLPTSIAFSPDGNLVATGHGMLSGLLSKPAPGLTILWDAHSGKRVSTIRALVEGVHSIAFSPDGKTLAVLEYTGVIRLITIPEGREIRRFETNKQERAYYSIAFFPNGDQLAVGVAGEVCAPANPVQGNEILILDLASGKPIRTLAGHAGPVTSVAVSPDGKLLASGAMDGTARIWDVPTGKLLKTLTFASLTKKVMESLNLKEADMEGLGPEVKSVAFSPDGLTLATAACVVDESGEVGLWEVSTGKPKATLKGVDGWVSQAVFSPDGKTLVTACFGGPTTTWDTSTFRETGTIGRSFAFAFSPAGRAVAATVDKRTVVIRKSLDADRR